MTTLYKLGVLCSVALLLTGIKCVPFDTEVSSSNSVEPLFLENHQPDFAEDTVRIYEYLALAKSFLNHDADKTISNAKLVLQLSQKHQWNKGKILAYNVLSTFYLKDGSYDLLRELSNETLILSTRLKMPMYTGHALRFMAESYSEYRQWDSAQVNYEHALKTFVEIGDDSSRAICLENMGNMHREQNEIDEARLYYDKAYGLFDQLKDTDGKALVEQSLGYLYVRCADYENANQYYLKALEKYKRTDNFFGQLSVYNDLGNSYYWAQEYDKSIEASTKALAYSRTYHTTQQSNWAHQTLGRSYKAKNMLKQSIYHSEHAYYYRRKIHEEYIRRQYTMYQLMYENQQMESAIQRQTIDKQNQVQRVLIAVSLLIIAGAVFLWSNNKKLRLKNAEIKEAMTQGQAIERKRMAADLHDNLGGTLASLNWYLHGIDKTVLPSEEQKIYSRVQEMVSSAYREVRSLSHNLMPAELEEYGLVMALNRLSEKLNENKSIRFTFNHNLPDKRYGSKTEFELYSIVLELANNIIKHSGATHAEINLIQNAKTIALTVSDNGRGIGKNVNQGIGLGNIKNRVESLSGKIRISDHMVSGTQVHVEIPNTHRA